MMRLIAIALLASACVRVSPRNADAMSAESNEPLGEDRLSFKWKFVTADRRTEVSPQEFAAAAVYADALYVGSARGWFYSLRTSNGELRWRKLVGSVVCAPLYDRGMLYVGTNRLPFIVTVHKPGPGQGSYDFIGEFRYLPGPRGLPLLKPPFGSMVAIDMNSGEHRWRIPVGNAAASPALRQLGIRERLGFPVRSWALVTKTVLVVVQTGYFGSPRIARWMESLVAS